LVGFLTGSDGFEWQDIVGRGSFILRPTQEFVPSHRLNKRTSFSSTLLFASFILPIIDSMRLEEIYKKPLFCPAGFK